MLRELFAAVRGAEGTRRRYWRSGLIAGFAVVSLGASQTLAAPNISPGCAAINNGALDSAGSSDAKELYQYLVKGDQVNVTYSLPIGGEVRLYTPGEDNAEIVLDSGAAASGTLSATMTNFTQVLFLASRDVPYNSSATCASGPVRPLVYDRAADVRANQPATINADVDANFDYETVEISQQPAHGTARYENGDLIYTPNAGFTGYDVFYYTATNQGVVSSPASVKLRVATGPLELSPGYGHTLPVGMTGRPMTLQMTAQNCAGTCTFSVRANQFRGGKISVDSATGLLTIMPTNVSEVGSPWSISVSVEDEGVQAQAGNDYDYATYWLDVETETKPTATNSSGRVWINGSQQFRPAVSGNTRSVRLVSGPSHGTASECGSLGVCYDPAEDYAGADSFQYVAVNEFGESAPATFTISVQDTPSLDPPSGTLPVAVIDESYELRLTYTPRRGDTYFEIVSGALPSFLTLEDNLLHGQPTAADIGEYTFTVRAWDGRDVDDNLPGDTATYTLRVGNAGVTATDKTIEVPLGSTPLPVLLTAGATGGPFTDAAILNIEPPQAGTAKLTMGEFAALTPDWEPGKYYLKFIPNPNFKGTAVVYYALRGAAGVSNNASVTFTVPLGVAAIANQVDGLVRGFVTTRQSQLSSMIEHPGLVDRRAMGGGQSPGTIQITPSESTMAMSFASSLADVRAWNAVDGTGAEQEPFNAWIEGSVAVHLRNEEGLDYSGSVGLVSLGADYLVNDRLLAGLAVHIDTMDDGVSSANTNTKGRGILAGPYISAELGEGVFLDASVLYGHSWNNVSNGFFSGDFETERLLAKAKLNGLWQLSDVLALRPDATLVLNNERVGDYTVSNGLGDFITVAGFNSMQLRLSAGGTLEYRMVLENGLTLTPEIGGSLGLSGTSAARVDATTFGTLGAGFSLTGSGSWTLGGNVDLGLDTAGLKSATARTNLGVRF